MPKITDLTEFTGFLSATDVFPVVNSSLTKKISLSTLRSNIFSGGAVGENNLATGAVTTTKLGLSAVTNEKILDGTVTPSKLQSQSSLSAGTYGSSTAIPVISVSAQGLVTAASSAAVITFPTGMILSFATSTTPSGWLLCDGAELTQDSAQAALLSLLSAANNPFGVGANGRPRVPNLSGHYTGLTSINHIIKL